MLHKCATVPRGFSCTTQVQLHRAGCGRAPGSMDPRAALCEGRFRASGGWDQSATPRKPCKSAACRRCSQQTASNGQSARVRGGQLARATTGRQRAHNRSIKQAQRACTRLQWAEEAAASRVYARTCWVTGAGSLPRGRSFQRTGRARQRRLHSKQKACRSLAGQDNGAHAVAPTAIGPHARKAHAAAWAACDRHAPWAGCCELHCAAGSTAEP